MALNCDLVSIVLNDLEGSSVLVEDDILVVFLQILLVFVEELDEVCLCARVGLSASLRVVVIQCSNIIVGLVEVLGVFGRSLLRVDLDSPLLGFWKRGEVGRSGVGKESGNTGVLLNLKWLVRSTQFRRLH